MSFRKRKPTKSKPKVALKTCYFGIPVSRLLLTFIRKLSNWNPLRGKIFALQNEIYLLAVGTHRFPIFRVKNRAWSYSIHFRFRYFKWTKFQKFHLQRRTELKNDFLIQKLPRLCPSCVIFVYLVAKDRSTFPFKKNSDLRKAENGEKTADSFAKSAKQGFLQPKSKHNCSSIYKSEKV